MGRARSLVGNAVPPVLAQAVAKQLLSLLAPALGRNVDVVV